MCSQLAQAQAALEGARATASRAEASKTEAVAASERLKVRLPSRLYPQRCALI